MQLNYQAFIPRTFDSRNQLKQQRNLRLPVHFPLEQPTVACRLPRAPRALSRARLACSRIGWNSTQQVEVHHAALLVLRATGPHSGSVCPGDSLETQRSLCLSVEPRIKLRQLFPFLWLFPLSRLNLHGDKAAHTQWLTYWHTHTQRGTHALRDNNENIILVPSKNPWRVDITFVPLRFALLCVQPKGA